MMDWFANLEAREQRFVGLGGVLVVVIVLWGLVWMPLDKGHRDMQESVMNWQRSLSELRVLGASSNTSGNQDNTRNLQGQNDSVVVVVDRTLRERQLNNTVKRQQPTPNGIRVEFENVAFDQLVIWIADLNANYGMDVAAGSMSLASQAGPGRINASLTLERMP